MQRKQESQISIYILREVYSISQTMRQLILLRDAILKERLRIGSYSAVKSCDPIREYIRIFGGDLS